MSARPLIITGCGRSGTGYAAALLTAAGAGCGHEAVFTGNLRKHPTLRHGSADASWFAVPYLADQRQPYIVHQVRHPLRVVASWVANCSMESQYVRRFLRRWCPTALAESTAARCVLRYWIDWNQFAARLAHQRWAVDQIRPGQLAVCLRESGRSTGAHRITAALKGTSPQINTRARVCPISWDDFGGGPLVDEAQHLVRQMGYWP